MPEKHEAHLVNCVKLVMQDDFMEAALKERREYMAKGYGVPGTLFLGTDWLREFTILGMKVVWVDEDNAVSRREMVVQP
jgi:hypothetical protein